MIKHHRNRHDSAGFTAIELVVSLAVIILVSAQVFVSFSGLGQGVTLNRAGQEFVGEIRKAQYASLAVSYAHAPAKFTIPPAFGILIMKSSGQTIRFADHNNDGKYNGQSELISTYTLPNNIKIDKIIDQNNNEYDAVHILFQVPEATLIMNDGDGTEILNNNRIDIHLVNGAGQTKIVTAQITGQINVQ